MREKIDRDTRESGEGTEMKAVGDGWKEYKECIYFLEAESSRLKRAQEMGNGRFMALVQAVYDRVERAYVKKYGGETDNNDQEEREA